MKDLGLSILATAGWVLVAAYAVDYFSHMS